MAERRRGPPDLPHRRPGHAMAWPGSRRLRLRGFRPPDGPVGLGTFGTPAGPSAFCLVAASPRRLQA